MAARGGGHVYATLLLSDNYLPGALVLAHSLRDAGTKKELAVLVTLDTVSAEAITQLKTVFDHVIPVPRIRNDRPANLYLMDRADLHSAFTKVNLWRQTQFSKIVYIDADVVAYRAPDELFDISEPFSAAPDIGWPDLFNTGVMVLAPNMGDYYALVAMAERGISFDGADQGLLNMHFRNSYNRISFTYNVTPSAHYQYIPAYRHFQSSINMVHFIGSVKPWSQGRDANKGDSPFDEMYGRWWAVYDRHYRALQAPAAFESAPAAQSPVPEIVQYFTKGEYQPRFPQLVSTGEHHERDSAVPGNGGLDGSGFGQRSLPIHGEEAPGYTHREHGHQESQNIDHDHGSASHVESPSGVAHSLSLPSESFSASAGPQAEAREEQFPASNERGRPPPPVEHKPEPAPTLVSTWDAQRQPPPVDSKPEAINFPHQVYEMSKDTTPFMPPERYPSPPKNMWYEVPQEKPAPVFQQPRAIFPWEGHQPRPSRTFIGEFPGDESSSAPTETSTTGRTSEPATPATPTIRISPSDPWTAFTRSNAWDEVPEIERYVEGLQQHRRTKSQGTTGISSGRRVAQERGFRLTDFPSEVDRPSLPVTPAPIRRPKAWGSDGPAVGDEEDGVELPAAEGVPGQSDWDPVAQLQKLAKQQSEALLRRLGGDDTQGGASREIPTRPFPFGSEGVTSSTYMAQPSGSVVLSPQPVKGGTTTSIVRDIGGGQGPLTALSTSDVESLATNIIQEPSYHGPGVAWEKGEDIPTQETPALPTDKTIDLLDS